MIPSTATLEILAETSATLVVTAPRVTDPALNGKAPLASTKVSNSAAVMEIAVMPSSAILRPFAKTIASLASTAPMVTEFALNASSAKRPSTAASASLSDMESI